MMLRFLMALIFCSTVNAQQLCYFIERFEVFLEWPSALKELAKRSGNQLEARRARANIWMTPDEAYKIRGDHPKYRLTPDFHLEEPFTCFQRPPVQTRSTSILWHFP